MVMVNPMQSKLNSQMCCYSNISLQHNNTFVHTNLYFLLQHLLAHHHSMAQKHVINVINSLRRSPLGHIVSFVGLTPALASASSIAPHANASTAHQRNREDHSCGLTTYCLTTCLTTYCLSPSMPQHVLCRIHHPQNNACAVVDKPSGISKGYVPPVRNG